MSDLQIEDGSGRAVRALDVHIQEFLRLVDRNISPDDLARTSCLRFIDPFGDTVFNELQLETLVKELSMIADSCKIAEEKKTLRSIIEFISDAEIHMYVKFYGD
jgi:hypothetical protein